METYPRPNDARTIRIRAYRNGVQDLSRTFRARSDANTAEFLKRGALAALPKPEGWHLLVVSIERTRQDEGIASMLDGLARRMMDGGPDFAAALAVTGDGARAALAVTAKDAERIAKLRSALAGKGRR
jgi:hypothetical protein